MEEPVVDDEIVRRQGIARARADGLGHRLGKWRWNGQGSWHAQCQNKYCRSATAWVSADKSTPQPYGGPATIYKCG